MSKARDRRNARRAAEARKQALAWCGLVGGAIIGLPSMAAIGVIMGSAMSGNDALFNAIVKLFA